MEITRENIEALARQEYKIGPGLTLESYREMGRSVKVKFRSPTGASVEIAYLSKKMLRAMPKPHPEPM